MKKLLTLSPPALLDPGYQQRLLTTRSAALIGLWPLSEAAGPLAADLSPRGSHAAYSGAGLTFGVPGMGNGKTGVAFDGADSYVQICRTAFTTFETDWNGNLFSMLAWGRVDSAQRWEDASTYRYLAHVRAADATYYAVMGKSSANRQLEWRRRSGGAIVAITHTFNPAAPLDWFCMGLTCDQSKPLLTAYLWSRSSGFLQAGASSSAALTDWGANPPTDGTSVLMAGSLTLQEWIGSGAYAAMWAAELTPSEMRRVMTP